MSQSISMDIGAFDIKDKYNKLISKNTLYSYLGHLSESELDNILLRTEKTLTKSLSSRLVIKKLYNILLESIQNIYSYLKDKNDHEELLNAYIFVNRIDEKFTILTGNYILKEDVPGIKRRIELINSMTKNELKNLYRGVLDVGDTTERGGAGLGFIDMAKRASSDLVFDFLDVNEKYVFFTLETAVIVEE